MRVFFKIAGAALLALGLVGAPSEAAMRLKAGHILPPTSDQGQAAEFFAKRVKELTNGEIEIQVFHAGELGKSIPSQLENLVSGAQDLFIDTFDYFKAWDPRFGVVNTPFVFRDRDHFKKFLASDLFADMVASLEKRGVVFLEGAQLFRCRRKANEIQIDPPEQNLFRGFGTRLQSARLVLGSDEGINGIANGESNQ